MQGAVTAVLLLGLVIAALPVLHAARSGDGFLTIGVLLLVIVAGIMTGTSGGRDLPPILIWAAAYIAGVFGDFTEGARSRREAKEAKEAAKRLKSAPPAGTIPRAPRRDF